MKTALRILSILLICSFLAACGPQVAPSAALPAATPEPTGEPVKISPVKARLSQYPYAAAYASAAEDKKNKANARNILALAEVSLIAAAATKDKKFRRALSVVILALTLTGCGNAVGPVAVENTPAATAASVETATPEITPTVVVEPTLRPTPTVAGVEYSPMAVNPPVMNPAELQMGQRVDGVRDDSAAAAVYALVRTENGPQNCQNNEDFIEKMNQYLTDNSEVNLVQVEGEGVVYSMLVNNKGQIYLVFNNQNGALVSADPGYWSKDGHGEWIEAANLGDKESVSLVPGEDGHVYTVKLDADGKVIAYLNTHGATRDNIDQQWISVADGMPEKVWDGSKWVEAERKPEFVVNFNSLTPESIDDIAGVVRRDNLQADLAILHQEIFEALEAEGVTAEQLPYMGVNFFMKNDDAMNRFFLPSEYTGIIGFANINGEQSLKVVLTKFKTGDGYVLSIPFAILGDSGGKIGIADYVMDLELIDKLDVKRQAAGSGIEFVDEVFIRDVLIPNLQLVTSLGMYGPFGELRDEYLQYAEMMVKADPDTDTYGIVKQIEEGKILFIETCNIYY